MTEETTTEQLVEIEGQGEVTPATEYTPPEGWRVLQVGEALREGDVIVHKHDAMYATARAGGWVGAKQRYIRLIEPQPQPEPVQVPEPQAADTPATEYTPPEGWRVVRFGEQLLPGDVWVNEDGTEHRSNILQWDASAVSGGRCIRRIKPSPEPEAQPIQVREGRWRTRGGEEKNIRPCEPMKGAYFVWPWTDGFMTFQDNGLHQGSKESPNDLVEYLGPIDPVPQQVNDWPSVRDLRHELKTVQTQLGESRQRVTHLEELVASLRTINRGCENAVRDAGKENTALRNQLAAVKAELASVAADRQRLQIELDAAQQVPPAIADRFQEGWNQGTARAAETVLEWLEPIRLVDSAYLANATLQHLPQIMRHLTGLDSHAID